MAHRFRPVGFVILVLLAIAFSLWSISDTWAGGGAGVGISFDPDTVAEGTATGLDFIAREIQNARINLDLDILVSESFANQSFPISDFEVNWFLAHIDSVVSNEYGINQHDFGLVYNYFANASYEYGDTNWGTGQNVVFFEASSESLAKRNHVDYYLAMDSVDATGGQYTSFWVDPDEDPGPEWHWNSFNGTDGSFGKNNGNADWYVSGAHANLMFDHEYQHLCNHSNLGYGYVLTGWPNEMFSTAAEYISGPGPASPAFGQPWYDVACDQSLFGVWRECGSDDRSPYPMWRLWAAYLVQQFNTDESGYDDDLLYEWLRTSQQGYPAARDLYQLGTVLTDESKPWHDKLAPGDNTRMGKLRALFRDWSIAKALNDTTRMAPGDTLTLGFGRGFSPYWDIGLFRDIDQGAPNSGVLPNVHTVGSGSLNNVNWVQYYRHPSDSSYSSSPAPDTVVWVPSWGADYVLLTPTSYYESGGEAPYDLKFIVRGVANNKLPYQDSGQRLQVSLVTYSSAANVFKSGADVIAVKTFDTPGDSGKVTITVHDFGDSVKAALVILGLTGSDPLPEGDRCIYSKWQYKYAYWVTPYWTSGSMADGLIWADSVRMVGDVSVPEGSTLTVAAGTHVGIAEGCSLYVAGTMNAEGGLVDPVEFEPASASPESGDWPGLYCTGTVDIEHSAVKYAGTGMAVADGGVVTMDGCEITDYVDYGLNVSGYGTEVNLKYTTLTGDSSTLGVIARDAASVGMDACTVSSFKQYGADVTGPDTRFEASGTTFSVGRSTGGVRGDSAACVTLDDCAVEGEGQYCVYVSGDEDTLYMSGGSLQTKRKDGVAVRLLGGPHAIITGTTMTGDADSLTYGIKSDATGGGSTWLVLNGADIADQKYGLYASQTALSAEACHVNGFSAAGVYFLGSGTWNCSLERCRLDGAASGATGVHLSDASSTTLWRDTIECSVSNNKSGVELIGAGQGSLRSAAVESCFVSGFQNDLYASYMDLDVSYSVFTGFTNDGVKAAGSDVVLSHNTVSLGSTGVRGIELSSGTAGAADHNNVTCTDGSGLRYGILSSTDGVVDLEYNWLEGMKYGIRCSGASNPSISSNRIRYTTGNAIQCMGDAYPTIRYTTVEHFKGTGIAVGDNADPNLGTSPDSGSCRVFSDSTFSYYVANLTEYSTMAEFNWWGTNNPSSSKFYGDVDYSPLCQSDPGSHYALPMIARQSAGGVGPYALQSYPNPLNPRTTIEYGVIEPGTEVRIVVYDISGRAVKVLVDATKPVGHHSAMWDGTDDSGQPVASGVYFSEVAIGDFRESRKIVVLR